VPTRGGVGTREEGRLYQYASGDMADGAKGVVFTLSLHKYRLAEDLRRPAVLVGWVERSETHHSSRKQTP